jgi:hypothetical protein
MPMAHHQCIDGIEKRSAGWIEPAAGKWDKYRVWSTHTHTHQRERDTHTERETHTHTERDTHTQRERDTHTERERLEGRLS